MSDPEPAPRPAPAAGDSGAGRNSPGPGRPVRRAARGFGRRLAAGGRWFGQRVNRVRSRVAGGETGMIRLFDLHALSIAGDTLVAVGLAGTIFFAVPLGEARSRVALYLLVSMVPFALLAPLIGPLLDHFRHGRRYALATTMLGRAILAWLVADVLDQFWLYPATFGVLVFSRAYGVARAATVPRLLPQRLRLSQINARGSVYGTTVGALVAPIGAAAFWFGPQWPLRVASAIFLAGMVIALRLPAQADSDPPETPPRLLRAHRPNGRAVLTGPLVLTSLLGGLVHRALYGFLLVFLAFAIRAGDLPTELGGMTLGEPTTLAVVSGALVAGTFLAVAAGSRLRIRRPTAWLTAGLAVVAMVAIGATIWFNLVPVTLLCLVAAVSSGLVKVAVDSTIQERLAEQVRTTAFAHSETLLMLGFVTGGAIGLIPMAGQLGIGLAAGLITLALVWSVVAAIRLRDDRLLGRPPTSPSATPAGSGATG